MALGIPCLNSSAEKYGQKSIVIHISVNGPMYIGFYITIKIVAIHPPPTSHQYLNSRKLLYQKILIEKFPYSSLLSKTYLI